MRYTIHVLSKILGIFVAAVVFFSLMLNLIDLLTNITRYLNMGAPIKSVIQVMLYYIPKTVWYGVPMAYLFAVTFVVSDMYAHNEMIATFVSGISLFRFSLPILITGLILSFGMFFFEDKLVVPTYEKKTVLQNELLQVEAEANNSNVIVISEQGKLIYFAAKYRDSTKKLETCFFIFRDSEKKLQQIIRASSAYWNEDLLKWELNGAMEFARDGNSFVLVPVEQELEDRLIENYSIFRRSVIDITTVNAKEAKEYIQHLRQAGLPYSNEMSEYYKKFAFPLIIFVTGFLALGLTGKAKKNHLLIGLTLAVICIVVFYVFQSITMVIAKNAFISPVMGAWLPDIVFIFISIGLLKFSRT